MGKRRKRGDFEIPNAECRIVRGNIHVRVDWDDTSQGQFHFVPKSSLQVQSGGVLAGGSRVAMRYTGGSVWTGTVAYSAQNIAAMSLIKGKTTGCHACCSKFQTCYAKLDTNAK